MKKTKIIIPALGILLLSTAASVTGTVAWFSMNTTVTAGNMQVKAVAEKGILINEVAAYDSTSWDNAATTSQAAGIPLRATSTANTASWFVAYSKSSNSAAAATSAANSGDLAGEYIPLTFAATPSTTAAVAGSNAKTDIYYVDDKTVNTAYNEGEGYYVKYTYYIKSSADAITCALTAGAQNLNIVAPSVTGNSGSADLDKALRVAIVVNSKAYIFAPLHDAVQTYYVGTSHVRTTTLVGNQATSLTSIPATTANGVEVNAFLYFEGEDPDLKTDNVTSTLDNLTVQFGFTLVTNGEAATDNGVNVA